MGLGDSLAGITEIAEIAEHGAVVLVVGELSASRLLCILASLKLTIEKRSTRVCRAPPLGGLYAFCSCLRWYRVAVIP